MEANKNIFQKFTSLYTDKSINGWIRGLMFVGTGVVVYAIGKKVYDVAFPSAEKKAAAKTEKNLDEVIKNGPKATYTDANYDSFANTIYESMRQIVGDNYPKVVELLKRMQNDTDVAKLQKAFGKRQNYVLGIPAGTPMDLFSFVSDELGKEWLTIGNKVADINKDWEKKGITFRI
jgi:hypothetical protein